jgi:hypothetical protein
MPVKVERDGRKWKAKPIRRRHGVVRLNRRGQYPEHPGCRLK